MSSRRGATEKMDEKASGEALVDSLKSELRVLYFTDGSARPHPGNGGAGVFVELPDGTTHSVYAALGTNVTNNVAELRAIDLALDARERFGLTKSAATVLTDSQYAHGMLVKNWAAKANTALVIAIRARLAEIAKAGSQVAIIWVAAHVGIAGNEAADALANRGTDVSGDGVVGTFGLESLPSLATSLSTSSASSSSVEPSLSSSSSSSSSSSASSSSSSALSSSEWLLVASSASPSGLESSATGSRKRRRVDVADDDDDDKELDLKSLQSELAAAERRVTQLQRLISATQRTD